MTDGLPPFADRHLGPGTEEVAAMLAVVGAGSLDELIDRAVPAGIRQTTRLALPAAAHRGPRSSPGCGRSPTATRWSPR